MTNRKPTLTVYLDEHQMREFESIQGELSRSGVDLNKTKLGKWAVIKFIESYRHNITQLTLDLRLGG